jgi:hypothetical protein
MEKRHFNRKRCLATAVAAAGLSAFAYNADAGLRLELTQSGQNPNGAQDTITINNLTSNLTLDVWATVTGTNGTSSDDGLQIAEMSFTSTGSVQGDFIPANPAAIWNSNGAQPGTQFNGPAGDFDLGSATPATAAGHWIAISDFVQNGVTDSFDGAGTFKLGTITFDPSAGTAGQTANLNLVPRAATQGALWFEDATSITPAAGNNPPIYNGTNVDKNGTSGTVTNFGLIVSFQGAVGTPNLWARP